MPDFELENNHSGLVAGIDEAGRGPWAGPVVAGAVIIKDRNLDEFLLDGLNDSKKLTAKKREQLFEHLLEARSKGLVCIGIGQASAAEIDEYNILQATFLAMRRAYEAMGAKADWALIDGNRLPQDFPCACEYVIKGDARDYAIAAASIMAKVYRDRLMADLSKIYPYYGFEKNAGYGTKLHIKGLQEYGVTPEHRRSYRPIREFMSLKKSA